MKRLEESLDVVQSRCYKLDSRIGGDELFDEITRKVAHTMTEIDQIMAQYGQGSEKETYTEEAERKISEMDERWTDLQ